MLITDVSIKSEVLEERKILIEENIAVVSVLALVLHVPLDIFNY